MMGLTWYMLGILTIFSLYVLYEYAKRQGLNWVSISGLALCIFSILFSIAWAAGAVLEGVPRAASMGLVLFGLGGVVILIATLRFITVRHKSS